jgi:hypothetical protein
MDRIVSIPSYLPPHKISERAGDNYRVNYALGYAEQGRWNTAYLIAGSIRNEVLQRRTIEQIARLHHERIEQVATGEADDDRSY